MLLAAVLAALALFGLCPERALALLRAPLQAASRHRLHSTSPEGADRASRGLSSLNVDGPPAPAPSGSAAYRQPRDGGSGALLKDYIKKLADADSSSDTNSMVTDYLRISLNKAREGHKATKYHMKDLINVLSTRDIRLTMKMKSALIRILVLTNEFDELANVVTNCRPVLGCEPLPDSFTLENVLRVLGKAAPAAALQAILPYHTINARYFGAPGPSAGGVPLEVLAAYHGRQIPLSEQCYAYAIKAIAALKTQHHFDAGNSTVAIDGIYTSRSSRVVVDLLELAHRQHGRTTTSLVITAMSSLQRLDDFQSAIAIYNFAKTALEQKQLVEVPPGNGGSAKREERLVKALPAILYGQTVVTLAKAGAEAQTFQVVCDMLATGCVPTAVTVDLTLLELSKRGSFNAMLLIVAQLKRFGVRASAMSLNAVLNACDKAGAYRQAVDFFLSSHADDRSRFALDERGLSVLIKCCDRLLLASAAVEVLEAAEGGGLVVSRAVYERVFAIFVKTGAGTSALRLLRKTEGAQSLLSGSSRSVAPGAPAAVVEGASRVVASTSRMPLMDFNVKTILSDNYKYLGDDTGLDDLFEGEREFNLIGGIMNVDSYSSMSAGGSGSGLADDLTEETLELLELRELLSDLITSAAAPVAAPNIYAATIASLSRQGLAEEAKELLLSYLARGGAVNEEMFTSSIYSFRYSKNPDTAEAVFRRLQATLADPRAIFAANSSAGVTISAFNALLSVYAISNVTRARFDSLLGELASISSDVSWNSYTYTAVLFYLGQQGRAEDLLALWRRLVAPGQPCPPTSTVNAMLRACILCNSGQGAMEVLEYLLLCSTEAGSGAVDTNVCNKVLIALNGCAMRQESLALLQRMAHLSIPVTSTSYTVVLSTLEKAADWKSAVNLLLQMQTTGVRVDSKSVNLAMSACAKAGEHRMTVKLYELMPTLTNRNFQPNHFTYYATLNAALQLKNSTLKMSVIRDMLLDTSIFPSFSTTNLIISLLESNGEPDASVYVFERLVATHLDDGYQDKGEFLIDLHGLTTLVSRASVRSALSRMKEAADKGGRMRDLVIITGIGKNSKDFLEPVLKPTVQAWLQTLEPPLRAQEVSDNPGRLLVSAADIQKWAMSA